jgi:hypothetical protein
MELDVTAYVEEVDCSLFAASQAELGERAGQITWNHAMMYVQEDPLVSSEEDLQEVRDYFVSTGGWTRDEADEMSDQEVNALLLQFIASAIRQYEDHFDSYEEYERAAREGQVAGDLWRNDDGTWTYYVGV